LTFNGTSLNIAGAGYLQFSSVVFANRNGNYHTIYEPAGGAAIYLGNGTDPGNYFDNTTHYFRSRGAGSTFATINSTGLSVTGGISATADITAFSSDKRLKTNVEKIESPIEKVMKISGYRFSWNELAQSLLPITRIDGNVGFIAQEVEKVLPEIIRIAPFDDLGDGTSKSGEKYLTVQYEKIVPLLVEAIKELQKEVQDLKNKIGEI
jgi:hypothetical protein